MAVDGSLNFDTKIDTSGFKNGTNSIKTQANGLKNTLSSLGRTMGLIFGLAQLVKFGKQAVEFASDLEEVQNVVDTAFGSMAYKMEEFAKTSIETFGISKLAAKEMGSLFMAMSTGMGQLPEQASDMAVSITGRLADIMSFYNKTKEEVQTIGKAIYTGETEPLKSIGLVATETNLALFALQQGFKKAYTDMAADEKLLVRQMYFLDKTSIAAGDFAKTSMSWANQTRVLSEKWKEFLGILGTGLTQVLAPVVQNLSTSLTYLTQFASRVGSVLASVFGLNSKVADSTTTIKTDAADAATSYSDMGDAVEEAAQKAEGSLASFDKLNEINSGADTAANAEGIATTISTITDEVDANNNLADSSAALSEKLVPLTTAIANLWDAIKPFTENVGDGLKWFYDKVLVPVAGITIDEVVPNFLYAVESALKTLNTTIDIFKDGDNDETIGNFISDLAKSQTKEIGEWFEKIGDAFTALDTLLKNPNLENAGNLIGEIVEAFFNSPFSPTDNPVSNAIENILGFDLETWYEDNIEPFLKDNGDIAFEMVVTLATKWEDLKQGWIDLTKNMVGKTVDWFVNFPQNASQLATLWFNLTKDLIGKAIDWTVNFPQTAEALVKKWILLTVALVGKEVEFLVSIPQKWEDIKQSYYDLRDKFIGKIVRFIVNIPQIWENDLKPKFEPLFRNFVGKSVRFLVSIPQKWADLQMAYLGLTKYFQGKTVDFIVNLVTSLGDIKEFINSLIDQLNNDVIAKLSVSWDMPSPIPDVKFSAPKIPRLATGTVIPANYGAFKAILGDNKKEPEIVSPLSTMKQAVKEVLDEMGGSGSGMAHFTIRVGKKAIFEGVVEAEKDHYQETGEAIFAH